MEKPLPFIIRNNDKLELNENVIKIIEKSINPRLLLFYGATRQGKSTTLNQIIRGNIDSWKYINRQPFETQTSQRSLTVGCNIFGPIKCSEIKKRHNLKTKLEEDFDIFFCDTEGLFSLNGQSRVLIPGILTLLQVCTLSVIMINSVADVNTISQISAEIQFSKLLQQINHDLKSPLVAIYVSEFQVDTLKYNDYDTCIDLYTEEAKNASDLIFENINEKYPNLNIRKNDFKVIAGGPYQKNNDKEPSHDDVNAMLYWNSINEIAKQFMIHSNKTQNYNVQKLISLIRIVFDIFKDFKDLPKDIDIKGVLIKYIKDSFKEFSSSQFETINEEIKKDLKNNYDKYYQMLIDRNTANEKLNLCIEKEKYEIYKTLIPEEIRNFMENAYLKLINSIVFQFEEEFKIKNVIITSKDYIMNHIKHIIEEINKANFQEDINMEIVNNYIKIWNLVEKENEGLFKFFKEKKPTNLENLKKKFDRKDY